MAEENTVNAEQQPNANPAETGEPAAKTRTFTQEEVNQIVSDRLARERAKTAPQEPTEVEKREQELNDRENKFKCKEFISENKKYPPELLDLLPQKSFDEFKAAAERIIEVFPALDQSRPRIVPKCVAPIRGDPPTEPNAIAQLFKPKY